MRLKKLIIAGLMTLSVGAVADGGHDKLEKYSDILEKRYSYVKVEEKKYDLEYELRDMDGFMLLEIEVEDSFLGKKHTDIEVKDKVEAIAEGAAGDIGEDFNKPVRVAVEYEDRNILMKKY